MTLRERNSLTAMKTAYDAFFDLPLSKRIVVDEELTPALGLLRNAIKEYSSEVRQEIVEAISEGHVNNRFTGIKKTVKREEIELI